jgi:transcriptional regulator with XRE-family HTH domain
MQPNFKKIREQKHLTQSELAEKSGLSLRTIQRIEAGNTPKGFTLRAIISALEIETELAPAEPETANLERAKLINLSAISGLVIPFGSIIFPLILTYQTKDSGNREIGKSIVSINIVLTVILSVLMIISPFIQKLVEIRFPLFLVPLLTFFTVKLLIIIRNGMSLNRNQRLSIQLKTNIL